MTLTEPCVYTVNVKVWRSTTLQESKMKMRKAFFISLQAIVICLLLMTGGTTSKAWSSEQEFSFAVLADPRGRSGTWKNALLEIRDRHAVKESAFSPAELIVVVGDMDPLKSRYDDYLHVFTTPDIRPFFLPVIGNHEYENGGRHFRFARDVLIPSIPHAVRRHDTSCDYYLDYKNVRIIVIDGYTDLGKNGVINDQGRRWVEQIIKATPSFIKHIFISFHEPAFPRGRHVGDSFDQEPELRNAFWRMLLRHKERVRAVLVGHTHSYSRLRVMDPAGIAANDPQLFPDEDGGIYQVDAGAAGNGKVSIIVQVQIEDKNVFFRVLQAKNGKNKPFAEIDKWSMVHHP